MNETVQDEILVTLVKENPVLYNKKNPNYKNQEVKKDTCKMISVHCGMSSAEEVENRWNQLRNYFGKKLREIKAKPASGSGGGEKAKKVEWYLMGLMSFLIPHISHQRGRSSMGNQHLSTSSTLFKISSPVPQSFVSSKGCIIESVQNNSVDVINDNASSEYIVIDSNISSRCESFVQNVSKDIIIDNNISSESSRSYDYVKSKPETNSVLLKKKKVMPDLDAFAKKRQKNDSDVENLLAQSTSVVNNLTTVVHKSISKCSPDEINEQKYKANPFAESIVAAFDKVPIMKQIDCLIAILNIIKTYHQDD
ncbi:hypothetical protein ALC62_00749 [Cyphomyrmex costatus]|uniref:MADF domain-containing protein n=1 Tax=Cyphomyrmex costatus TaxID=456900 RepID=A0A151IQ55_9HYME|nr:hypothetical protein ALC62_00749 [Cyphomyrmex costatus]